MSFNIKVYSSFDLSRDVRYNSLEKVNVDVFDLIKKRYVLREFSELVPILATPSDILTRKLMCSDFVRIKVKRIIYRVSMKYLWKYRGLVRPLNTNFLAYISGN